MWEFSIQNVITKQRDVIMGYDVKDAFRRYRQYDSNEWEVYDAYYID